MRNLLTKLRQRKARRQRERELRIRKEYEDTRERAKRFPFGG